MTTLILTVNHFCGGGGHARVDVTGAATTSMDIETAPFTDPVTDDEALGFIKVICKMAKAGRTLAQAKTLLLAGVTITV